MGYVHSTSLLRAPVSEMTYTVSSGTLNSSIPYRYRPWNLIRKDKKEIKDNMVIG